jgi:transcriptional regulator with XRE-family HTH domain
VAANLKALIKYAKDHGRNDIATNLGIERASKAMHGKGHLTRTTIRDIKNGRRNAGIDTLQMLAEVFGTQAWVLLTPHPKPEDLPVKPVTKTEIQLYKRLGKVAREYDELQREQQREEGTGGPPGPDSETPRSIGDGTRDGSVRGDDD